MSSGVLDPAISPDADVPRAEIGRSEDVDAELFLGHLLHFGADIALEERLEMLGVAEQVGRGQDRPRGDLVGDVLRRDVAHLEIAALQRDEFGALAEQRSAVVQLELEVFRDRLGEPLHHLGADVLL